jgi:hopanoid C-3 methylase
MCPSVGTGGGRDIIRITISNGIGSMNILLINPPNCGRSIPEERFGIDVIKMIFRGEPLALETLAGNLTGHEVLIADLKADPDGLSGSSLNFEPDLIGITGVTCEANTVLSIAKGLKQRYGVPVVVGGHHASCDPYFFKHPCVDYIVMGLGKQSFRELVDSIEAGRPAQIPGVLCNMPGAPAPAFIPRRCSRADLVDHAAPRYDLVSRHRDKYVMSGLGGKVGFVATAFGCTHACAFCCIPNMTGGKYLSHANESVMRDIGLLGDLPLIRLVDANTFGDVRNATGLGKSVIDAGMNKRFIADVRSDTVVRHPELFNLWRRAGLGVAVIGFEETSDVRLDGFNKKNTHQTNLEAIAILKELGIRIVGDFIISPDYGYEDFENLSDFVNRSGIDVPIPAVLTPLPGTPLYRKLKSRIINHDLDYYTFTNAVLPTRMEEKTFYSTYADMLKRFLAKLHGEGSSG